MAEPSMGRTARGRAASRNFGRLQLQRLLSLRRRWCGKCFLGAISVLKMVILSRQARDKHRKHRRKRQPLQVWCEHCRADGVVGRSMLSATVCAQMKCLPRSQFVAVQTDVITKTRSGQKKKKIESTNTRRFPASNAIMHRPGTRK